MSLFAMRTPWWLKNYKDWIMKILSSCIFLRSWGRPSYHPVEQPNSLITSGKSSTFQWKQKTIWCVRQKHETFTYLKDSKYSDTFSSKIYFEYDWNKTYIILSKMLCNKLKFMYHQTRNTKLDKEKIFNLFFLLMWYKFVDAIVEIASKGGDWDMHWTIKLIIKFYWRTFSRTIILIHLCSSAYSKYLYIDSTNFSFFIWI